MAKKGTKQSKDNRRGVGTPVETKYKSYEIDNFEDYRDIVSNHKVRTYMYRGQNNSEYKLESSLFRTFSRNKKIRYAFSEDAEKKYLDLAGHENEMLESFKRQAHIFLQHFPKKYETLDWLALMQHYGAPTRLLDFSFSPYIALYFAISGAGENDAAVYCIEYKKIKESSSYYESSEDEVFHLENENDQEKTVFSWYEPNFLNERLSAQQGVFLVPNTLQFSHEGILEKDGSAGLCTKLILKKESFSGIIKELYKMNITASTLFPGLEGFCRSFENIGIINIKNSRHLTDLSD